MLIRAWIPQIRDEHNSILSSRHSNGVLNGVVVIAVVVWLMNIFALLHSLSRIHVG
jgi:hypothetical protein